MKKLPANIDGIKTAQLQLSILNSPLVAEYNRLVELGWQFFAVDQDRGRCYGRARIITIPVWVFTRSQIKHNYWVWYVAHEMAHASTLGDNHGALFMKKLIELCPEDCIHYEIGYKPRNAVAAGIGMIAATSEKGTEYSLTQNILFPL